MDNPVKQIEATYYAIYEALEGARRTDPLGCRALQLKRVLRTARDWTIGCYEIEDRNNETNHPSNSTRR